MNYGIQSDHVRRLDKILTHKPVKMTFEKYWNDIFVTNANVMIEILLQKKIKSFSIYFRSIPNNLYLFEYLGTLLENTSSFSKGIDEKQAVIGKFKLYPRITMHIFPFKFSQWETETLPHVTNELMSNKLTFCKVSVFPLEKCILIFEEIRFEKLSGSFKASNDIYL